MINSVSYSQTRLTYPVWSSFPALYNQETRQEELWGTVKKKKEVFQTDAILEHL